MTNSEFCVNYELMLALLQLGVCFPLICDTTREGVDSSRPNVADRSSMVGINFAEDFFE